MEESGLDQKEEPSQVECPIPIGREVVFIAKALAATQIEMGKPRPSGIFPEDNAAHMRNPIGHAMYKEAV